MGKTIFSVLVVLAAVFAVAGECPDPTYQPGKVVIATNTTICDQAPKIGLDCSVLIKCLEMFQGMKVDPNMVYTKLTFRVPAAQQIAAAKKELEKELGFDQPKPASTKKHAKSRVIFSVPCDQGGFSERTGNRPFNKADYVRCVYDATGDDEIRGKTFADVARDFHSPLIRIEWFNDRQSNDTLLNGDQIWIPDWDFTYWRFLHLLPFGKRDPQKLWPKLECFKKHPQLVRILADKYARGEFTRSTVESGELFRQWTSGNYIISNNGVCAFPADTFVTAQRYDIPITGEDSILVIKNPDVCHNWLWAKAPKEPEVSSPPPVTPDTTPLVSGPDTVVAPPDTNGWMDSLLTPLKKVSGDSTTETMQEPSSIINNNRLDVWVSDDRPDFNTWRQGAQSYGLKWDCLFGSNKSRSSFGFTAMADGWDGESRSGFHYAGFEVSAGPLALISLSPALYWGIEIIGIGAQWNWGLGSADFDYYAFQTNGFLCHGETFDAMWPTTHLSLWGNVKWAFAANKDSRIGGVQQTAAMDPADNNSGADGGLRFYFLRNISPVEPLLVYRTAYATADHAKSNSLGVGVAFWKESLILELSFKNRSDSRWADNNGNAVELLANLSIGQGRGKPGSN
ncbi:MAG: hypothetical protein PHO56_00680 [Patescibacteria group bacterium]|nr:hypothetical protein [Patescibacteria group bacterium]